MFTELKKKEILAKKLLADPNVKEYRKVGFINDLELRNCKIIRDYVALRKKYNHLDALEKLSEQYYLSTNRIIYILYQKVK